MSKQEAHISLGKADRTAYVRSPASDSQSRRECDLSEARQFHAHYVNETLSRQLYIKLYYNIHRTLSFRQTSAFFAPVESLDGTYSRQNSKQVIWAKLMRRATA